MKSDNLWKTSESLQKNFEVMHSLKNYFEKDYEGQKSCAPGIHSYFHSLYTGYTLIFFLIVSILLRSSSLTASSSVTFLMPCRTVV